MGVLVCFHGPITAILSLYEYKGTFQGFSYLSSFASTLPHFSLYLSIPTLPLILRQARTSLFTIASSLLKKKLMLPMQETLLKKLPSLSPKPENLTRNPQMNRGLFGPHEKVSLERFLGCRKNLTEQTEDEPSLGMPTTQTLKNC